MVDDLFYSKLYRGNSIPPEELPRLAARAAAQLARYERLYRVSGTEEARGMATCAMADALYYFETAANGGLAKSSGIGSVSGSFALPDTSPAAQAAELYRCAGLYLQIHRGVGRC